jgi:hypothetical protein
MPVLGIKVNITIQCGELPTEKEHTMTVNEIFATTATVAASVVLMLASQRYQSWEAGRWQNKGLDMARVTNSPVAMAPTSVTPPTVTYVTNTITTPATPAVVVPTPPPVTVTNTIFTTNVVVVTTTNVASVASPVRTGTTPSGVTWPNDRLSDRVVSYNSVTNDVVTVPPGETFLLEPATKLDLSTAFNRQLRFAKAGQELVAGMSSPYFRSLPGPTTVMNPGSTPIQLKVRVTRR